MDKGVIVMIRRESVINHKVITFNLKAFYYKRKGEQYDFRTH